MVPHSRYGSWDAGSEWLAKPSAGRAAPPMRPSDATVV